MIDTINNNKYNALYGVVKFFFSISVLIMFCIITLDPKVGKVLCPKLCKVLGPKVCKVLDFKVCKVLDPKVYKVTYS